MRSPSRTRIAAVLVALVVATSGACGSSEPIQPCGEIPTNGCPIGRGGSCLDHDCAGLYDCVSGAWTLVTACPPGNVDVDAGDRDAACTPTMIDVDAGASGCTPDLEAPDCPVEAAETCAEDVCESGCTDFFVCEADGWQAVAFCDDQGHLTPTP